MCMGLLQGREGWESRELLSFALGAASPDHLDKDPLDPSAWLKQLLA